jgi:RNA polymerase sigma-70 factor, ECF subfamily
VTAPDRQAQFTDFYRREFGRVVASVRGQLGADAEDAAQEAFLIAGRRWDEVAELDVPAAWVRLVALRIARRRVHRERQRLTLERTLSPAEQAAPPDLDLVAALLKLPDRHAAAVWLHHLEDRPVAEVAERLGCSVTAAKALLLRARRLLAERLTGLTGQWVSERAWSPDAIVGYLRQIDAGQHVGPILDEDLGGQGGRWELTIANGAYMLRRDDGYRLDHGSGRVATGRLELRPTLNTGRAAYRPVVDGDRLHLRLVETTIPPTLGVPDAVWISLFLESGAFVQSRPLRSAV